MNITEGCCPFNKTHTHATSSDSCYNVIPHKASCNKHNYLPAKPHKCDLRCNLCLLCFSLFSAALSGMISNKKAKSVVDVFFKSRRLPSPESRDVGAQRSVRLCPRLSQRVYVSGRDARHVIRPIRGFSGVRGRTRL